MNQTNQPPDDTMSPALSELLSSPDLQEKMLNSLQAGVALLEEKTGRFLYLTHRLEELSGYRSEELREKGQSLADLLNHKDRLRLELHLKYPSRDHQGYYLIAGVRHADGVEHPYYLFFFYLDNGPTAFPHVLQVMFLPVNSRWNLPFTSYDSRELFLELFTGFGFGTFEWNIHSSHVFWSRSIYDIFEVPYTDDPIVYEDLRKYTYGDDMRKVRSVMQRAMEAGGSFELESRIVTAGGKVRTLSSIGKFIRNEQGEVVKLVGSVRDITDIRSQEARLKSQMAELNRSNRELEDFAYVASHDLQEPLRKISTFCDRFSEKFGDTLEKEAAFYLERINSSAENMRLLIQNLLEFSRVTRNVKAFVPVSLADIFRQVRLELELVLEETGTELVLDSLPVLEAEPSLLQQLFYNLVNNAIKFRKEEEKPVVKVTARPLNSNEKARYYLPLAETYYLIEVTDNGIGFEEEYAERIFQIFQRLHGKAEYPGSGIGLAICKKIVDHHKGVIFADGTPGGGAIFSVILPEKQPQRQPS